MNLSELIESLQRLEAYYRDPSQVEVLFEAGVVSASRYQPIDKAKPKHFTVELSSDE